MSVADSRTELAQHKMGDLITPERMIMAVRWAQARYEMEQQILPVRKCIEDTQTLSANRVRVMGTFLARVILYPEGFRRGDLQVPDSNRKTSAEITVAIQKAKRAGAIEIVADAPYAPVRAVATTALLLTALDSPRNSWLTEQARVLDPEYSPEQLWARFEDNQADHYRALMDLTPLPKP